MSEVELMVPMHMLMLFSKKAQAKAKPHLMWDHTYLLTQEHCTEDEWTILRAYNIVAEETNSRAFTCHLESAQNALQERGLDNAN